MPYAARGPRSSVGERVIGNDEVGSSILPVGTRITQNIQRTTLYGFRTHLRFFTYNFALCSGVVLRRFVPKLLISLGVYTLGYSLTKGVVGLK